MIRPFIIILFFFAVTLEAEEAVKTDIKKEDVSNDEQYRMINYPIDWKYSAGEYLIYDCGRINYACVDEDGSEKCWSERKEARGKNEKKYPCAFLKKFNSKKECILEQYKVVDKNARKRFCFPK